MASKNNIDVIIPSFNGKYLLEKHLPEIIANSNNLNKIIIIDNGSSDGTVYWLKANYPEVLIIENKTNLFFTVPINQGVMLSTAEYFVLLNNDVRPEKDYLKNIQNYFKDDKVFAVSFNEKDSSWPYLSWQGGKIQYTRGVDKSSPYYSAWASGGSAIFRRSIWEKIGGFNEIYSPFYWEDIDICFRSWKMGYKIIWDNNSRVVHEHESTSKKLNSSFVSSIKERNELLFNWLNITDKDLVTDHRKYLVLHTIKHPGYLKIIFLAVFRYLFFTPKQKLVFSLTDKEVLSLVNKKV